MITSTIRVYKYECITSIIEHAVASIILLLASTQKEQNQCVYISKDISLIVDIHTNMEDASTKVTLEAAHEIHFSPNGLFGRRPDGSLL